MNQNYVNLNPIFLRQESKNILLKSSSMFLSVTFQFIIAEKSYTPQKTTICYTVVTFTLLREI